MQTDVHSPASTMRLLPIRVASAITALSSHVFMLVRSKNFAFGKAVLISSNIGPEKVFSATVVGITDTLKTFAALEISAALLRSVTASIDFVAKAIWDWKSIRISVWSPGESSSLPGLAVAVGILRSFRWSARGQPYSIGLV